MVQKESRLQWMNIETHKSEINKMLWLQCCFLFPGFLCCFLQSLTSLPPLPSLWFHIYFSFLSAYGYSLSFLCSSWISHIDTLLPFQPVLPLVCSSLCSFDSQRNLASPLFCSLHTPWRLSFLHHICIFFVIPGQTSQGQSHWLPRCLPFQTAEAEGSLGIFKAWSPTAPSVPPWRQGFGNSAMMFPLPFQEHCVIRTSVVLLSLPLGPA